MLVLSLLPSDPLHPHCLPLLCSVSQGWSLKTPFLGALMGLQWEVLEGENPALFMSDGISRRRWISSLVWAPIGKVCHDCSFYQWPWPWALVTALPSLPPNRGSAFLLLVIFGVSNFPYFISQLSYHLCNQYSVLRFFCSKFSCGFHCFLFLNWTLIDCLFIN